MKECVTHHHACDCREAQFAKLRSRLKAQRRELRNLNKTLNYYWHGWRDGVSVARFNAHRARMIDAFGLDAVCAAEYSCVPPNAGNNRTNPQG
jgi:ABC-type Fe3+-hydroxamate transport system substrate-binding protein